MLLISLCRKELRAEFMEKALALPSERYMPVVSIPTATLLRWSSVIVASSPFTALSSGASMVKARPISFKVFVIDTPQWKSTLLPWPWSLLTVALTSSVAVMFSFGL